MLRKIPFDTSAPILARYEPSDEVAELGIADLPPGEAMDRLIEAELMVDYVSFVAHALPTREAICWAAGCQTGGPAGEAAGRQVDPELAAQALERVRAWVRDPQERTRQELMKLCDAIGTESATGWLCYAVVWNGSGSIVPPENPEVLPQPFLHAKALIGAVALLSDGEEETTAAFLAHVDGIARDVAAGGWPGIED